MYEEQEFSNHVETYQYNGEARISEPPPYYFSLSKEKVDFSYPHEVHHTKWGRKPLKYNLVKLGVPGHLPASPPVCWWP